MRESLGLSPSDLLLVYSGSIGTWYSTETAIRAARDHAGAFLLFLTFTPLSVIDALCATEGLPRTRYAARAEMPQYLSAGEVSLCPVRPSLSKKASSPTKVAESLACGLPVVGFRGVGDLDELAASHPDSIQLFEPGEAISQALAPTGRDGPRRLAESHFSLELGVRRYDSLYSRLIR